jgi:hypothetical protein
MNVSGSDLIQGKISYLLAEQVLVKSQPPSGDHLFAVPDLTFSAGI